LLLPIKIDSQDDEQLGILQVLKMRDYLDQPIERDTALSEEERAASLNFIGQIAVAV